MATIREEFLKREDRDARYRELKEKKQKHLSRFSTSSQYVMDEGTSIKLAAGRMIYVLAIGV
jgi:hypothetical protein